MGSWRHACPAFRQKVPDQLLLLAVQAQHRTAQPPEPVDFLLNLPELPVPLGMPLPRDRLDVALERIAQLIRLE
jgi:hypothetical protein